MIKLPRPTCSICFAPYYEDFPNRDSTLYTYFRLDGKQTSKTHNHKSSISVEVLNALALEAQNVVTKKEWELISATHSETMMKLEEIQNRFLSVAEELSKEVKTRTGKTLGFLEMVRESLVSIIGEPSAISEITIGPDSSDIHGEILICFHFFGGVTVSCPLPLKLGSKFKPVWTKTP